MLLRRSGEISEESYNLSGVLGDDDVGVEDEGLLVAIAEAVFAGDPIDLAHIRAEAVRSIGDEKFVDAIGIASGLLIVPLQSLMQWQSPKECRGAVIALSNIFINFSIELFG